MANDNNFTKNHERANALSHAVGIIFGLFGVYSLFFTNHEYPFSNKEFWGLIIYSSSLIILFSSSTLYHTFTETKLKAKTRIIDHIAIFFVIGGSTLPFVLKYANISTQAWFISTQWGLIGVGIILKLFFTGKYRLISSIVYTGIGAMVVVLGNDFWSKVPNISFYLILAGGLMYLTGVYFYQNRKIPFNHFIWHLFVLAAAILHWFGVKFIYV